MKKVTKKALGILALVVLSVPVQAGWLSNLGQRIVNGAANTVQTNISGKVNKAVNDVMDGKVGNQPKTEKNQKLQESYTTHAPDSKTTEQPSEGAVVSKITSTTKRGRAIPYTNKYEIIDAGVMKFKGERIFGESLNMGTLKVDIDQFLDPGYYAIAVTSRSSQHYISAIYEHESEGVAFGYGIIIRKKIYNTGNYEMYGGQNGLLYTVEVLPNTQGHLELTLVNNPQLRGAGDLTIFKIPGPNLEIIK